MPSQRSYHRLKRLLLPSPSLSPEHPLSIQTRRSTHRPQESFRVEDHAQSSLRRIPKNFVSETKKKSSLQDLRPCPGVFVSCLSTCQGAAMLPAPPYYSRPIDLNPTEIAAEIKQWFESNRGSSIFELIYDILESHDNPDEALSSLNLRLSEEFVILLLRHHRYSGNVLSCLKFFDWAGRQPGYHHTRATYHAIFKILRKAKLISVMLEWLESFSAHGYVYRVRFYDTLIMGYSVAGKVDVALHLFGRMRFRGLDLNVFAYHVLLNSLVEENRSTAVDMLLEQISIRGLENPITCCLKLKHLFKQNKVDEAKMYLLELESNSVEINENMISSLVGILCRQGKFDEAESFVERFKKSGHTGLSRPWSILINDLVEAGNVDAATNFLSMNNADIREVSCYNKLILWFLKENRFEDVYDLLVEMIEKNISPDLLTMNSVLCFFCKAGMVDVAEEIYNSRVEIGFSLTGLTYNHLINALCRENKVDEAFRVLEDSLKQGFFPSKKTFYVLADKLCIEGKLDKMSKLLDVALERQVMLSNALCAKYVLSLCKAGRAEEGYFIPQVLNKPGYIFNKNVVYHLVSGLIRLKRGDLASELLVEKKKNGCTPSRSSYLTVIRFLCENGQFKEVSDLLEKHVTGKESVDRRIYNYFIDGVGHAMKPEIAEEAFTRMVVNGLEPNIRTKILILRCFLKSGWIQSAVNYFDKFSKAQEPNTRLYNTMIIGLCQANRLKEAILFWKEMRQIGLTPSLECYEEFVKVLCSDKEYYTVVDVVNDLKQAGREVSPFICNTLLLQSLRDPKFEQSLGHRLEAWNLSDLELLVHIFSGKLRLKNYENLDKVIEKLCAVDLFTYNILLKALNMAGRVDYACELFGRISQKGYEPNHYTYDIMLHGLCKHGQLKEAETLKEEMNRKGFHPSEKTRYLYEDLMRWG